MARPRSALTTFILSLPHNVPVKDVIAQAKAKGLEASERSVYRVRQAFGATSPTAKTASPSPEPMSARASASLRAPVSKAQFVRSLPVDMPAKTVLAMAKSAGISLSKTYLYLLRGSSKSTAGPKQAVVASTKVTHPAPSTVAKPSSATSSPSAKEIVSSARAAAPAKVPEPKRRRKATARTKTLGATRGNGASTPRPITSPSSAEDLLRAVAAEIGLGRAVGILEGERARVRQVIGT